MSEFGKGFFYPMLLFIKHYNNAYGKWRVGIEEEGLSLWINGASDHLYGVEIPSVFSGTEMGKKLEWLIATSLEYGKGTKEMEDMPKEIFNKMGNVIDELGQWLDDHFGIKWEEAEWK